MVNLISISPVGPSWVTVSPMFFLSLHPFCYFVFFQTQRPSACGVWWVLIAVNLS